jgi:hypothetical protein
MKSNGLYRFYEYTFTTYVWGINHRKFKAKQERFQAHTAASMKMTAFWNIVLCSFIKVDRRFRGVYCFHHRPDKAGSMQLLNIGLLQQDYTAQ